MVGKPSKTGEQFKLTLGMFTCIKCEKRFRTVIGKETVTFKGVVEEIQVIQRGFVHTLEDLREKIWKLKDERTELLEQIDELKKSGEKKATALEEEITALREEVESLKEILEELE
jgi:peptidoglycan hydrolase CwlO-like protein